MSFPSYNPLTNGITTGAFGVVSFNIVDPDVNGGVPAANATLFAANGKAMILAITSRFNVLLGHRDDYWDYSNCTRSIKDKKTIKMHEYLFIKNPSEL
jgi:hypothetical protein